MTGIKTAAFALLLSTATLVAASPSSEAAVVYGGVGQHATVMGNIRRAQQRDNAAISHVQNNIRSTRHQNY